MTEMKSLSAVGIVAMEVGNYTVQRFTQWPDHEGNTGWLTCWTRGPEAVPGIPSNVPAVFNDITDAEERLNQFRDNNPGSEYRMVQTMTIVQVVHA